MKSFWQKRNDSIVPADDPARAVLARLKPGELVVVDAHRPRNIRRLRLYWTICQHIADALGNVTRDNVSDVLKIESGHYRVLRGKTSTWRVPSSISVSGMSEDDFIVFLDRAKVVIQEQWFPGMAAEVRAEIDAIINGERDE